MHATLSITYSGLSLKMFFRVTRFQIHNVAEHHFQSQKRTPKPVIQRMLFLGVRNHNSNTRKSPRLHMQDCGISNLPPMSPQGRFLKIKILCPVSSLPHHCHLGSSTVMESCTMADGDNSPRSLRFTTQAVTVFTSDTLRSFLKRPVFLANGRPAQPLRLQFPIKQNCSPY